MLKPFQRLSPARQFGRSLRPELERLSIGEPSTPTFFFFFPGLSNFEHLFLDDVRIFWIQRLKAMASPSGTPLPFFQFSSSSSGPLPGVGRYLIAEQFTPIESVRAFPRTTFAAAMEVSGLIFLVALGRKFRASSVAISGAPSLRFLSRFE